MSEKKGQPHLMAQDAKSVDPSRLTALTPEVVSFAVFLYEPYVLFVAGGEWDGRHAVR